MTAVKPFIKKSDRIRPVTARDFAALVHRDPYTRVLYRVFDNADSARVSAYNCERLNVFDGLDVAFEVGALPRGKHGVYGVVAKAKVKRRTRAPKVSDVAAKKAAPAAKKAAPAAKKAAPAAKKAAPAAKKAAPAAKKAARRKAPRKSAA